MLDDLLKGVQAFVTEAQYKQIQYQLRTLEQKQRGDRRMIFLILGILLTYIVLSA